MITPWTIQESEIALYPAWGDGMPITGPSDPRGFSRTLLRCKTSLSISFSPVAGAPFGFNVGAADANIDGAWEISVSIPDGAHADDVSRILSRMHHGGLHVLVVAFEDVIKKQWTVMRFFYVTISSDESSDSSQVMRRQIKLRSTYMREVVGSDSFPSMDPVVVGEVDWVCGSTKFTCLNYDPESNLWSELPANETGDAGKLIEWVDATANDVDLMVSWPSLESPASGPSGVPSDERKLNVSWDPRLLFSIGNHLSLVHHGMKLGAGFEIQQDGTTEPLFIADLGVHRQLDPVLVVFRYLRNLYCVVGCGKISLPELHLSEDPVQSHLPVFRFQPSNKTLNPETGRIGMVLSPDSCWLDGTVNP